MSTHTTLLRRAAGGAGLLGVLLLGTACGGGDDAATDTDTRSSTDASQEADPSEAASDDTSAFTDQSAQEIADASKEALKGLDTVHFAGAITSDGQDITLDIRLSSDGDCQGTFGTGGAEAELLSVGGQTWFRPDAAFWKMSAGDAADQIIAAVGDKYVTVDASDDSFSSLCDLDSLLDASGDTTDTYTKGDISDLDGTEVIAINRTGSNGDSVGYVQTGGDHYLVKLEKMGDDAGSVVFDEFDEALDVTAPAADEQISQAELGG